MNKTLYASILLVSVILGFMVAFQFRTASRVDSGVPIDRLQILTTELQQLDKEYSTLLQEAHDLEQKLTQAGQGRPQASQAVLEELLKVRQLAGMTKMQGPGVEVNIAPMTEGENQTGENLFAVRDENLLLVINELRAAGAEALAINGQRVISTSEIRLAGAFIDVNLTRISAPYSILAIGAPDQLESALIIKGGLVDTMGYSGIDVTINKRETIIVPAYTHRINLEYAKPLKEAI